MTSSVGREEYLISNKAELRSQFGDTTDRVWDKSSAVLTTPMLDFIEKSPFCCISSSDASGRSDISPRGPARPCAVMVRVLSRWLILKPCLYLIGPAIGAMTLFGIFLRCRRFLCCL